MRGQHLVVRDLEFSPPILLSWNLRSFPFSISVVLFSCMSPTKFLNRDHARSPSHFSFGSQERSLSDSTETSVGLTHLSEFGNPPNQFPNQILIEADLDPNRNTSERSVSTTPLQSRPIPVWKRTIDLIASLFLIVVLSPLLLVIAIIIKLGSRGPVLFKQKRLGYAGKEFVIYKFRTLKPCSDATQKHRKYVSELMNSNGAAIKPDLHERLIPGGGWLRRLSLDELPQLINIIKGEMSLIGPRPDVLIWEDYEPYQLKRFEVQPGVTGLWQVSGKNRLSFNQMIEKDFEYISKRSIRLDLLITIKTFLMLFRRDNG